jgi:membrane-bound ClpP family serine protease
MPTKQPRSRRADVVSVIALALIAVGVITYLAGGVAAGWVVGLSGMVAVCVGLYLRVADGSTGPR